MTGIATSINTSRKYRLRIRRLILAGFGALLLSSFSIADLSAQGRSNKGGEVRGKDRASQVQEMNKEAKEEKDAAREDRKSERKAGKSEKSKKNEKSKKRKKGKRGKKNKGR